MSVIDPGLNSTQLIEDIAYLVRSEHRVQALVALTIRPRSRSELWELTGVSSSTIRRTLREFEKRNWVRKREYRYEATPLGAFVESAMEDVIEQFEIEQRLRDVWHWLPDEESGFSIEMCSEAVVTVADADDPYGPVNRFLSLLEDSDAVRFAGFDIAMLQPCEEALCERIGDGMRAELINPPRVAEYIHSSSPAQFAEAVEKGNLTIQLHDELPSYGVSIFDDRIAVSGYGPDCVTVRVVVDTAAPEAREWAEAVYDRYRREAQQFRSKQPRSDLTGA